MDIDLTCTEKIEYICNCEKIKMVKADLKEYITCFNDQSDHINKLMSLNKTLSYKNRELKLTIEELKISLRSYQKNQELELAVKELKKSLRYYQMYCANLEKDLIKTRNDVIDFVKSGFVISKGNEEVHNDDNFMAELGLSVTSYPDLACFDELPDNIM